MIKPGIIMAAHTINCSSKNGFFAGGHGDFSVILDEKGEYFYFLFTNYGGGPLAEGIAIARMEFADRFQPMGAVYKYFDGDWFEPGIGGSASAIFPAHVTWANANADSFWGPSIHWNTYLRKYVMLLNRACCEPRQCQRPDRVRR